MKAKIKQSSKRDSSQKIETYRDENRISVAEAEKLLKEGLPVSDLKRYKGKILGGSIDFMEDLALRLRLGIVEFDKNRQVLRKVEFRKPDSIAVA